MGNTNSKTSPLSTHGNYIFCEYTPILTCGIQILERDMCDKALNKCATNTCTNSTEKGSPICKPCSYAICNTFDKPTSTDFFKKPDVCGNTTHCNISLAVLNRHSCLFCESKICNKCIKSKKIVHSKGGQSLTTNYCCDSCYTALNKDIKQITQNLFFNNDKAIDGLNTAVNYNVIVYRKLHNK